MGKPQLARGARGGPRCTSGLAHEFRSGTYPDVHRDLCVLRHRQTSLSVPPGPPYDPVRRSPVFLPPLPRGERGGSFQYPEPNPLCPLLASRSRTPTNGLSDTHGPSPSNASPLGWHVQACLCVSCWVPCTGWLVREFRGGTFKLACACFPFTTDKRVCRCHPDHRTIWCGGAPSFIPPRQTGKRGVSPIPRTQPALPLARLMLAHPDQRFIGHPRPLPK